MVRGRALLVEGFSTKGISGSPVVADQRGLVTTGGLIDTGYRPSRLIGLVAGYLGLPDHEHGHLTYVFKSSIILECGQKAFPTCSYRKYDFLPFFRYQNFK